MRVCIEFLKNSGEILGQVGRKATLSVKFRAQELCESRGGRPGLPAPNSRYGLCGQ